MTMPKLTPMQWGAVILVLGVVAYFAFFHKKKPAVTTPATTPATDGKKESSGYNAVDATMVSQGSGI
jgi:hypothetical protein